MRERGRMDARLTRPLKQALQSEATLISLLCVYSNRVPIPTGRLCHVQTSAALFFHLKRAFYNVFILSWSERFGTHEMVRHFYVYFFYKRHSPALNAPYALLSPCGLAFSQSLHCALCRVIYSQLQFTMKKCPDMIGRERNTVRQPRKNGQSSWRQSSGKGEKYETNVTAMNISKISKSAQLRLCILRV